MSHPPGLIEGDGSLVGRLNKALYDLKQAPRVWFHKLYCYLIEIGFSSAICDTSLFIKDTSTSTTIILVYVDDILITGNSPTAIVDLISSINSKFPLKDLGHLNYFLGFQVSKDKNGAMYLTQTKYINDLLEKANMHQAKSMKTPMVTGLKLSTCGDIDTDNPTLHRSIVGGLQYVTVTRPDIAYSVNKACQFMHAPKESH